MRRHRMNRFGIWLLLLAWIAQQLLMPSHAQAMARQDPLRAAFCGLVSAPAVLAQLVASAPPELLKALQRAGNKSMAGKACSLCASGHAPVAAGEPAAPMLFLERRLSPLGSALAALSIAAAFLAFHARGPPTA